MERYGPGSGSKETQRDAVPEENSKNPVLPPLSAEAQTIDYKGSIPIDYLTASADAVYLVSRDQDGDSKS